MTKETQVPQSRAPLRSSGETSRIASGLVWPLSSSSPSRETACGKERHADRALLQAVEAAILARSLRPDHVPSELLLDPAWDMLLELFRADLTGEQATASSLAKAAGVTTSSGPRWIDALVAKGLCVRGDRADDGRMAVDLSSRGSDALRAYFVRIIRPEAS